MPTIVSKFYWPLQASEWVIPRGLRDPTLTQAPSAGR